MKKPEPAPGLVNRYDYLWRDEAQRGRQEGSKDRPCAIVVARITGDNGERGVLLAPVTHSPPHDLSGAIEIPPTIKSLLGLDDDRSWIVVNELNSVDWSDPGITPVDNSKWAYGFLPLGFAKDLYGRVVDQQRRQKLKMVDRGVIGKRRS